MTVQTVTHGYWKQYHTVADLACDLTPDAAALELDNAWKENAELKQKIAKAVEILTKHKTITLSYDDWPMPYVHGSRVDEVIELLTDDHKGTGK